MNQSLEDRMNQSYACDVSGCASRLRSPGICPACEEELRDLRRQWAERQDRESTIVRWLDCAIGSRWFWWVLVGVVLSLFAISVVR